MSPASWRYASTYVLSFAFGITAAGWGLFVICVPEAFHLISTWATIQESQQRIGVAFLVLGVIQASLPGPIARGLSIVPTLLAAGWTLIVITLANIEWRTTGTAIYGMLAAWQVLIAFLSAREFVADAYTISRETVRRLIHAGQ